jgi:hypothetical protein
MAATVGTHTTHHTLPHTHLFSTGVRPLADFEVRALFVPQGKQQKPINLKGTVFSQCQRIVWGATNEMAGDACPLHTNKSAHPGELGITTAGSSCWWARQFDDVKDVTMVYSESAWSFFPLTFGLTLKFVILHSDSL